MPRQKRRRRRKERVLYFFHPSVFALVNKNAFANLTPFNTVDTRTGVNIKFLAISVVLFAAVFLATLACSIYYLTLFNDFIALPLSAAFLTWFFHHLFGAPVFWLMKKRLSYKITAGEVVFERNNLRIAVPLASVRKAFVIPTATMGAFGYHNICAVYERHGRLYELFLYGAPNKDLAKILALIERRR